MKNREEEEQRERERNEHVFGKQNPDDNPRVNLQNIGENPKKDRHSPDAPLGSRTYGGSRSSTQQPQEPEKTTASVTDLTAFRHNKNKGKTPEPIGNHSVFSKIKNYLTPSKKPKIPPSPVSEQNRVSFWKGLWKGASFQKLKPDLAKEVVQETKNVSKLGKLWNGTKTALGFTGRAIGTTAEVAGTAAHAIGGTASGIGRFLGWGATAARIGSRVFLPVTLGLAAIGLYKASQKRGGLTAGAVAETAVDTLSAGLLSGEKIVDKAAAIYEDLKNGNSEKLVKTVENGASQVADVAKNNVIPFVKNTVLPGAAKAVVAAGETVAPIAEEVLPVVGNVAKGLGKAGLHLAEDGTRKIAETMGDATIGEKPTRTIVNAIGGAYNTVKNSLAWIYNSSPVQTAGSAISEKGRALAASIHENLKEYAYQPQDTDKVAYMSNHKKGKAMLGQNTHIPSVTGAERTLPRIVNE